MYAIRSYYVLDRDAPLIAHVITSYSIHYTKLYEESELAAMRNYNRQWGVEKEA